MVQLSSEVIEGFVSSVLANNFDKPCPTPDFHRELWEICCSPAPLVAVAAPRGHAKSTAVSLSYVLAAALFRERQFVLLVSDTEGQAKEFLGDIKKELQINEQLINLFGVKNFVKDTETDIIVQMTDGYQFRIIAKGSEQKVRGLKWNHKRPDLIVCDDMENDEIVLNTERREKFRNWVIKALLPCRSPDGIVRVVGTILHLDSFLSRICPSEGEKFTAKDGLKLISLNPKAPWKSVVYSAHEGQNPYELTSNSMILWPERFSKEFFTAKYEEAVSMGLPEGYAQEYLNRPLDDTHSLFRRSDFTPMTDEDKKDINTLKRPLENYCGIDLAISQKERADWCVFHVFGIDSNNYLYHRKTIRERLDGREIVDTLFRLQKLYNLQWAAIEQDKIAKSLGPFIKEEMFKRGEFINIIPISAHIDPMVRVRSIQARMRAGGVKFDKQEEDFDAMQAEFLQFPRGRHDDRVAAAAMIGLGLDKMMAAQTFEEQQRDIYDDEMRQTTHFNTGQSAVTGY